MTPPGPSQLRRALPLLVPLLLLLLWAVNLDTPFAREDGKADWIGNHNGRIAANHLRYGLARTRGGQILNLEPAPEADWVRYSNHPASLDLMTAGCFWLFGSQGPWAHRILPLLGALLSFVLLARTAAGAGLDPWLSIGLFAALPTIGIHGINLSYEPLCLPMMLLLVLLYERGRRFVLLPLLLVGGWIDYPVLYLAPFFAILAIRDPAPGRRRVAFVAALALSSIASFGGHLLHVLWTTGELLRDSGRPWHEFMLQTMTATGLVPGIGEWLGRQCQNLGESFTWPGLLLGLSGLLLGLRFRPGSLRPECAFLFAGSLHVILFRSHAWHHDFWLFYLAPFVALAGARCLGSLHRPIGHVLLLLTAVLGLARSHQVWEERAEAPVRELARDFRELFADEVVIHSFPWPGWAVETLRGHPVTNLVTFLDDASRPVHLDNLGRHGLLDRPQWIAIPSERLQPGYPEYLDRCFPGCARGRREGSSRSYHVYDITSIILDPTRSPELRSRVDPASLGRQRDRVRLQLVLARFEPGSRILFLDGGAGPPERVRGRWVQSGSLEPGSDEAGWHLVAWPGTEGARQLEERAGAALRHLELTLDGQRHELPWVPAR